MNTLLTKVKNAKITTREVLIHLRKTGELKRKQYLKYLKLQYLMAGSAYEILQSATSKVEENQPEKLNTHYNKKPAMPVNLSKSELSSMSRAFDEITFLAEAWRFYQKEQMKNDATRKMDIYPVSDLHGGSASMAAKNTIRDGKSVMNDNETYQHFTNKSSLQSNALPRKTLIVNNVIDKLNSHCYDNGNSTPFCIQILKWTMEGQFNLN